VIADWALFAIFAVFIWSVVNIVDKYVLTRWVANPIILIMITGIIGLLAGFIIFFTQGISYLSLQNTIFAIIAGTFYVLGNLLYFKAAKLNEISRVVPLFHLSPIFVLILAAIFLGEFFTPMKYLGIAFLVVGAFIISSKNLFSFRLDRSSEFMILSTLSFSFTVVITKYLLAFADFWTIFSYIKFGTIFVLVPIFWLYFEELKSVARKHGKKVIGLISINESFNVFAVLLMTIAAASGFITLVESLASLQALFVFLLALGLSIFFPKILKEEISGSTILLKLIAIVLLIAGSIMII
jgi:transporter family protein